MIGHLNPTDERLTAERSAIRARYWLSLMLLLVALLAVTDVVTLVLLGGRGVSLLLLAGLPVALLWDRCETALFRAGLVLWGGNERRRRGKKRLTMLMLALGTLLIAGYLALRISRIDSWERYWAEGDYDVFLMPIWTCIVLSACHGRIVSRRDQGDNIADRLEERAEKETAADEAE